MYSKTLNGGIVVSKFKKLILGIAIATTFTIGSLGFANANSTEVAGCYGYYANGVGEIVSC